MIIGEMIGFIETQKANYQQEEPVTLTGELRYKDGTPAANMGASLKIQSGYGPREIPVETDSDGRFEYTKEFGAGAYSASIKVGLLSYGGTSFTVWGLAAKPSSLTMVASKNSQFSKIIEVYNPTVGKSVTGLTAQLINLTPESNVRAVLDTSTLGTIIAPEQSAGVVLNINAPLEVSDTAEYQINFSTAEGAVAATKIKILLRPAVPFLS